MRGRGTGGPEVLVIDTVEQLHLDVVVVAAGRFGALADIDHGFPQQVSGYPDSTPRRMCNGGMQLPQGLARFNVYITNPIQRMWAGRAPGTGILEHVGRRSGRTYRTPLTVFSTDDGVAILLTYGPDRDWLKNLTAAGHATMHRHGRAVEVRDPQVTTKAEAAAQITGPARAVFGRLPFENAVLLKTR